MISDEVFRKELDASLKRQKILKKQRNATIADFLKLPIDDRDSILELADRDARNAENERAKEKHVPLESVEQEHLVAWFRSTYPDKVIALVRNDGSRNSAEKVSQKLQGLHVGFSDLVIPHLHVYLEMKRCKPKDSPWSEDQQEFKRYVEEVCGDTYILGYGCEDAKEKILKHIDSMLK